MRNGASHEPSVVACSGSISAFSSSTNSGLTVGSGRSCHGHCKGQTPPVNSISAGNGINSGSAEGVWAITTDA
ncbi:MAG: hypothetical protein LKM36_10510 [Flavobacteriales bacterium]|nr:hypothetical protein [Flavobacteriales bacterium]